MIARTIALLALTGSIAAQDVTLRDPVALTAPAAVAREWWQTPRGVRALDDSGTGPRLTNVPAGTWRVDQLDRIDGGWKWARNAAYSNPESRLPAGTGTKRVAVLVRNPAIRHRFGWAEYQADQKQPVEVSWFTNFVLGDGDEAFLWSAALEEPLRSVIAGGDRMFRRIPPGPAYACERAGGAMRCAAVDHENGTIALASAVPSNAAGFILHREAIVRVSAEGRSLVHPIQLPATHLRAGRWNVVLVADPRIEAAVFDWLDESGAMTRVNASGIAPLPSHTPVIFAAAPGIDVRVIAGSAGKPVTDVDARLVFLEEAKTAQIPLAVIAPTEDGIFRAPQLSAGKYRLKLLAANAPAQIVTATIEAHPTTVRFDSGPSITGRLVMTAAGSPPADSPLVQVVFRAPPAGTELSPKADLVDLIRQAVPDSDGAFEIALPVAGTYALRAQWGAARAQQEFVMPASTETLDLGPITLSTGATLSGTIAGCAGGELQMTPLPQAAASASFFEFRRVTVAADASFSATGLSGGTWILAAKCRGTVKAVVPELIELPTDATRYVDLKFGGS